MASSVIVTMRVLPDHPFDLPLSPGNLPLNWIAAGQTGRANAYLLPASHARLVEDHERTPEDLDRAPDEEAGMAQGAGSSGL